MDKSSKQLGEILVEKGLVTQDQLEDALKEQKFTKEFLGTILLRRKLITEEDFLKALSEQFGFPFVSIEKEAIDFSVAMRFSPTFILDQKCIPIKEDEYTVTVAIVNPLNALTFSNMEKEANLRTVNYVLVSQQDMHRLIQHYLQYKESHGDGT